MGLASSLTTALTGMTAAETQIDVAGNNLANSQTVGFKSSKAVFANQFLQTLGLGSSPTSDNGGTDPRQTGLGVQVAAINPDFSQGTIEVSKNPSDLAIQGDGFFIVEGNTGEKLYTRNGIFKTNAENELVNTNGNRLLGFGVDETFTLQRTEMTSLTIPLGSAAVAKSTTTVELQGVLTPTGDVADTAEVIESAIMGDGATPRPDVSASSVVSSGAPDTTVAGTTVGYSAVGGTHLPGSTYRYKLVFADSNGKETLASNEMVATVPVGMNTITLSPLPTDTFGEYTSVNVYRTDAGGSTFKYLRTAAPGGTVTDDNSVALSTTELDTTSIDGNYSYMYTFYRAGYEESRPAPVVGPINVVNGRPLLRNLPTIPTGINPPYTQLRIYRNLSPDASRFYLVDTVTPGSDYTDSKTDAMISAGTEIDLDGPKAGPNTLLADLLVRDGLNYENAFDLGTATSGTLSFSARKGGRSLAAKDFEVTASTTLADLMAFMDEAMGIRSSADDAQYPIPSSIDTIDGSPSGLAPGGSINGGKLRFVSNNGVDNALAVTLSSFQFTPSGGITTTPNLGYGSIQDAKGQSAVADFIVYDSLGIPLNVRLTSVLESRNGSSSTYRWYADSAENDPTTGDDIAVGHGLVTFDGNGNMIATTNTTVSIDRRNMPSASPLEFDLDFSQVSGLAQDDSNLAASRQDGSPPGTLTSFLITEDGVIRGVFSNGAARDLGQLRIARFANNLGLEQRGQNLYAQGVNSGLPIEDDPGQNGIGSIIAGAVELSNTDVGKNLIELVLASTQYRGSARVITTTQQMFEELMNLRR